MYEDLENLYMNDEVDNADMLNEIAAATSSFIEKGPRKVHSKDKYRESREIYCWEDLYSRKSDEEFKDKLRISRRTFSLL